MLLFKTITLQMELSRPILPHGDQITSLKKGGLHSDIFLTVHSHDVLCHDKISEDKE